jgi:negative regulator of sigma E activity
MFKRNAELRAKDNSTVKSMISPLEELSAYMDEESCLLFLEEEDVLQTWQSYHLASAALKGDLPQVVNLDFCKAVRLGIEQELAKEEWAELIAKESKLYTRLKWLIGSIMALFMIALFW